MTRSNSPVAVPIALALLSACASEPQFPNASPEAVAECRREAAVLAEPDPWRVPDDPIRTETGGDDVIEDARTAESELQREGLAGWPEEILIYRCLVSQGETLTTEQARKLADWEETLEPESR
ncbi:MAG TPA: hypothetical protein VHG33_10540 [Woeseiaceae bacterium]|nr:hypothetical protein [Woeseiaceae bacterium]